MCRKEGGCCIQAQTYAAHAGRSTRKVLRHLSISPSIPPSFTGRKSSCRCIFTITCRKPKTGRRNWPDVGVWRVSLYPSIHPPPSPSFPPSLLLFLLFLFLLLHPSLPRLPSSISLNFELDVSEMLINSARGRDDKGDKRRLFGAVKHRPQPKSQLSS